MMRTQQVNVRADIAAPSTWAARGSTITRMTTISASWITMSISSAASRPGKLAIGTSRTTASPVTTSATACPPGWPAPIGRYQAKVIAGYRSSLLLWMWTRMPPRTGQRGSGGDPALIAQLSTTLARGRAAVGGAHSTQLRSVARFAAVTFPLMAYRIRWWWLATAAGSLLVALIFGWWVARTPAAQASLVSKSEAADLVRHQFRDYYSQYAAGSFAAKVWTNNVWVAAEALISGILLGIPTLYVLLANWLNIGVDGGLMAAYGKSGEFFGLILPHGMLELSAVFL